ARAFARHLDQAELADAIDGRLRLVLRETLLEGAPDLLAVAGRIHVDEVEDHEPADVAEAELVGNLVDGLEIRLERGLLEIAAALAHVTAGVHVDRRQRFSLVDD